jgi:two-component system, OmpR family, response regulator CpxR
MMESTDQSTDPTPSRDEYTILLVDDDVELCALMTEFFSKHGYSLDCVYNGRDGLAQALKQRYDLVILDVMLPALDGFEVLRQLRKRSEIPVIMLTGRNHQRDRIAGLDSGADDYLSKPFGPDELLARIRAVLRRYDRTNLAQPELLRAGPIELNPATRVVTRSGEAVVLTEIEFQILELLMRSPARAVSRDEIAAVLYQREHGPYERSSIDVHLSHLRKKLQRDGPPLLRNVRGVGYVLTPEEW